MDRRSLSLVLAVVGLLVGSPVAGAAAGGGQAEAGSGDYELHDDGFTVTQSHEIGAEPARVYRVMVDEVGRYWHPDHTFSGDATRMTIEARPGGCFCERLGDDGFVRHLEVTFARPGELLRLVGGLGPLGEYAVNGVLSLALRETETGTRLDLTYRVSGRVPQGFEAWAEPVSFVLRQQMERLKRLIETGSPEQR